ncbi:MAG: 30S ribosomal protein S6 [Candidatus Coatesbacteria bacterium]|nr:MAG: 30S ribosomal protein S6 [Candidatus Coatesbacteria bacterium]
MNSYELLVLTKPDASDEDRDVIVKRIEGWLKDAGSEVVESKFLGVQKLAYPIKKLDEAAFNIWFVDGPPEMPSELAAKVRIDEDILRHLLIERHPLAETEITKRQEGQNHGKRVQ